jgi:hypothetical protein
MTFLEKHCIQRHYMFLIKKCDDRESCGPLRGKHTPVLPDPVLKGGRLPYRCTWSVPPVLMGSELLFYNSVYVLLVILWYEQILRGCSSMADIRKKNLKVIRV